VGDARDRELPYAWVIVALSFFALALPMGIRSSIGLLVRPWEVEFGWDRAAVSLTASFGFLAYGLAQPLAGRWADRYGPRAIFTGSLILLGVSTAALGRVTGLWHAYLAYGLGLMAATGGASNVTAAVAIARWIRHRRALAMGIAMAGAAAGQLVLVPALAAGLEAAGWRTVYLGSGIAVLLIGVPVVWFLFRDDPPGRVGARTTDVADTRLLSLAEIAGQRNFWWLAGGFWVCGVTTAGLIDPHLIPYAHDLHIDPLTAATAFGVLGTFNVLSTLAAGVVSDRWGHKWVLGSIYAGRALTLVFLVFVREPISLFVFAVAFGIVDFATVPPTTALSTTLFGRRSGGTVIGLVSLSHQIGSAMGSYAGGLVHDWAGSYVLFFLSAALLCVAAAVMSWAIAEAPAVRIVTHTT
jgi:MFS family permease